MGCLVFNAVALTRLIRVWFLEPPSGFVYYNMVCCLYFRAAVHLFAGCTSVQLCRCLLAVLPCSCASVCRLHFRAAVHLLPAALPCSCAGVCRLYFRAVVHVFAGCTSVQLCIFWLAASLGANHHQVRVSNCLASNDQLAGP